MTAPVNQQDDARLASIEAELRSLRALMNRVLGALTGSIDGDRQGVHARLHDHDAQLGDHDERLTALESAREKGHQRLGDRLWQVTIGAALGAFGAVCGALFAHWPKGHP